MFFLGFPIGVVVAKTQRQAQQAAKLVKVIYEDLPAILTIPVRTFCLSLLTYALRPSLGSNRCQFISFE